MTKEVLLDFLERVVHNMLDLVIKQSQHNPHHALSRIKLLTGSSNM
jgi:hypothetical protein